MKWKIKKELYRTGNHNNNNTAATNFAIFNHKHRKNTWYANDVRRFYPEEENAMNERASEKKENSTLF